MFRDFEHCCDWLQNQRLTRPGRIQPVLDVEDLLILGAIVRLLTDFVVLRNLLLQQNKRNTQNEHNTCQYELPHFDWF